MYRLIEVFCGNFERSVIPISEFAYAVRLYIKAYDTAHFAELHRQWQTNIPQPNDSNFTVANFG